MVSAAPPAFFHISPFLLHFLQAPVTGLSFVCMHNPNPSGFETDFLCTYENYLLALLQSGCKMRLKPKGAEVAGLIAITCLIRRILASEPTAPGYR